MFHFVSSINYIVIYFICIMENEGYDGNGKPEVESRGEYDSRRIRIAHEKINIDEEKRRRLSRMLSGLPFEDEVPSVDLAALVEEERNRWPR